MGLYRNEETGEIIEYYKKDDIALSLYQHYYLDKYGRRYTMKECKDFVNHVFEALSDIICDASVDADIYIRNFGTFKKVRRKYNTSNFGNCDKDLYANTLKFKASSNLWNLVHQQHKGELDGEINEAVTVTGRNREGGQQDGGND